MLSVVLIFVFIWILRHNFVRFILAMFMQFGMSTLTFDIIRIHFLTEFYGRDKSHGYLHAWDVMRDAIRFYKLDVNKISNNIVYKLAVVTLMHDVADGKYDKDGKWKIVIDKFFEKHFSESSMLIDIVYYSSYSKEQCYKKDHPNDSLEVLLTPIGYTLWIYLSSADRIQSLGVTGHERSKEYNSKRLRKEINTREVYEAVSDIMQEKLLTLKEYIYSESAALEAEKLTIELVSAHNTWLDQMRI